MTNEEALWVVQMIAERDAKTQAEADARNKAVEALEKQIPKKPITVDDGWRYWDCPTCGARVGSNMDFKYWTCLCGQRIDWSKVE